MKLQVYVSQHCATCSHSVALGQSVALEFSDVTLEVYDLDDPSVTAPEAVFGVPTFLLDGRLLSLGNQDRDWLVERLRHMSKASSQVELAGESS